MNLKNGVPKFNPTTFSAEVVDIADPNQTGRVRVRVHGLHSSDIDTDSLPWAVVVSTNDNPASAGISAGGIGLQTGSWVLVTFLDEQYQSPVVLGTIISRSTNTASDLPLEAYSFDINSDRRSKKNIIRDYTKTVKSGIDRIEWKLPSALETERPVYTRNKVSKSRSGHIHEIDDTPGYERILRMHRTGSFDEYTANGDKTTVVNGKDYKVVVKDSNIAIFGNCNVTVYGDVNMTIEGNESVEVLGNSTKIVRGDYNVIAKGKASIGSDDKTTLACTKEIFINTATAVNIGSNTTTVNSPGGINLN
jgi:uncharacterized protein involved in type VI secretion and phage assembly